MKLAFVYVLTYFYFQITRRFSADDQVKHCLVLSFTRVLCVQICVLSGLDVESKAANMESDFAHQIRLGGGSFSGCGGQAEQERRPYHKSIYQALGFNKRLCEMWFWALPCQEFLCKKKEVEKSKTWSLII